MSHYVFYFISFSFICNICNVWNVIEEREREREREREKPEKWGKKKEIKNKKEMGSGVYVYGGKKGEVEKKEEKKIWKGKN